MERPRLGPRRLAPSRMARRRPAGGRGAEGRPPDHAPAPSNAAAGRVQGSGPGWRLGSRPGTRRATGGLGGRALAARSPRPYDGCMRSTGYCARPFVRQTVRAPSAITTCVRTAARPLPLCSPSAMGRDSEGTIAVVRHCSPSNSHLGALRPDHGRYSTAIAVTATTIAATATGIGDRYCGNGDGYCGDGYCGDGDSYCGDGNGDPRSDQSRRRRLPCVRVRARACVRARVRACVRASERAL